MACKSRPGDGGTCFDIAQRLPYPMPPHVCHVQQPVAVRFVRCAVAARLGDGRQRRLRGGERPVILYVFNFFRATGISEICFSNLLCGTLYPLWYTVSFMVRFLIIIRSGFIPLKASRELAAPPLAEQPSSSSPLLCLPPRSSHTRPRQNQNKRQQASSPTPQLLLPL